MIFAGYVACRKTFVSLPSFYCVSWHSCTINNMMDSGGFRTTVGFGQLQHDSSLANVQFAQKHARPVGKLESVVMTMTDC